MSEPADPLVSPHWLAARLGAPDVHVVDATWRMPADPRDARADYAARRIPGAVFFDIDEIADLSSPLPHMLPSAAKFAARVGKLGLGDGCRVVIYDGDGLFSAARAWWMFRAMGHEDVVVLDGGLPGWEAEDLPLETDIPVARTPRHFTARIRADLIADLETVRRAAADGDRAILDARPAARFAGEAPEPRPGLACGHMPGARSMPFGATLTEKGAMRSKEDLAALLPEAADLKRPIITTCGSGVTAAILNLALARLGRWDAALYDGSWAEWGALSDAPIATGA